MKKETQVKIIKSIYFIVGALLGVVSLLFALEAVGITESLRATTPIWIPIVWSILTASGSVACFIVSTGRKKNVKIKRSVELSVEMIPALGIAIGRRVTDYTYKKHINYEGILLFWSFDFRLTKLYENGDINLKAEML
tara:strand:- start:15544 stop:15957 length:414 start_codon:yes stop_codon:yes gene_type:complete